MSDVRVYKLVYESQPEPPEDWHRILYGYEYAPGPDPEEIEPEFTWPTRALYLSRSGAQKRKRLLERLGAAVRVEASQPVVFAAVPPEAPKGEQGDNRG
jgi:hypothetical protein